MTDERKWTRERYSATAATLPLLHPLRSKSKTRSRNILDWRCKTRWPVCSKYDGCRRWFRTPGSRVWHAAMRASVPLRIACFRDVFNVLNSHAFFFCLSVNQEGTHARNATSISTRRWEPTGYAVLAPTRALEAPPVASRRCIPKRSHTSIFVCPHCCDSSGL